uniref:Uncharacterized protein n=1 Tax=Anguilla anguilla TaxID=7936 RepID=A0A0E9R5K1_ANGAN
MEGENLRIWGETSGGRGLLSQRLNYWENKDAGIFQSVQKFIYNQ